MTNRWRHSTLNLSPVVVFADRAVTLGLLITEPMINANKHTYGGFAGPIEIGLIEGRTLLNLTVSNKGNEKISYSKGFGSRIVEGLMAQLGGELGYGDNHPGFANRDPDANPESVTVPVDWVQTRSAVDAI